NKTRGIRVISAEAANNATRRSPKSDADSGRKIDHVISIDDAVCIGLRGGQNGGVYLPGKLGLNRSIGNRAGGWAWARCWSNREFTSESAVANGLIATGVRGRGSRHPRGGVFRKQVEEPAGGDIGVKLVNRSIRCDCAVDVRPPEHHDYLYVGNNGPAEIGQVGASGSGSILQACASSSERHNVD